MRATGGVRPTSAQPGYSLLELIVGLSISLLIIGGLLTMLYHAQVAHRDFEEMSSAQQALRIAAIQIQRDLSATGVGLAPMVPVFSKVVPLAGGGIRLLRNPGAVATLLDEDMDDRRRVRVESVLGFAAGRRLAVYDAFGTIDLARVERVAGGSGHLWLDRALGKRYRLADGAAAVPIEDVSYWVERRDGVRTLFRQVDSNPPQPVVEHVGAFRVHYYDNSRPPVEIRPADAEEGANIRAVEVVLGLEAAEQGLDRSGASDVWVKVRVMPRSLSAS